jgi:decaprenylphospho-beta-D-ribofuranose 2-oxidase
MSLPVKAKARLSGWGNYPVIQTDLIRPEHYSQLNQLDAVPLARGLGRSSGDAALCSGRPVLLMERLRRIRSFDPMTGVLRAEAGITLDDLLGVCVPEGWFLPFIPETRFASLGGCTACNAEGVFGSLVKELEIILPSGKICVCSPECDPDLFWATVGGLGLTGVITEISLQLKRVETAYMVVSQRKVRNLEEALACLQDSKWDSYSAAWIDCSKRGRERGTVVKAHHAQKREISKSSSDLLSLPKGNRFFNWLNAFQRMKSFKSVPALFDYEAFFSLLDTMARRSWRYGRRGLLQYQCAIPVKGAHEGLKDVLMMLSASRQVYSSAVLKRSCHQGKELLSFPMEGYTLALDLSVSPKIWPILDEIDQKVLEWGGRVCLAKDVRLAPDVFRRMYPGFQEWRRIKRVIDPQNSLRSDLSKRLKFEEPA